MPIYQIPPLVYFIIKKLYDWTMRLILHYILIIAGVIFILIGIAGLFLPVIPGIFLIVLGLIVMGKKELVTKWIEKLPAPFNQIIFKSKN